MFYKLVDRVPVPVGVVEWFEVIQSVDTNSWLVRQEYLGDIWVSTVFVGMAGWGTGPAPTLFETMVFNGTLDGERERYATWAEAEAGHAAMVARVRETESLMDEVDAIGRAASGDGN
jgi:hypothetical protein